MMCVKPQGVCHCVVTEIRNCFYGYDVCGITIILSRMSVVVAVVVRNKKILRP